MKKIDGFTLVELMITISVIAIVTAIALPKFLSSRLSANENAAIATLRAVSSAQSQFVARCAIDTDADGGGEYAYFGELAGVAELRWFDGTTGTADIGPSKLTPPIHPSAFSELSIDVNGHGVAERAGYFFKIWLPGAEDGSGKTPGVPEEGERSGGATSGSLPSSDECEVMWACYAWPVEAEKTGNRVFFVNQEGDILQCLNADGTYDGLDQVPDFDAAYSSETGGGDMGAGLGLTAQILNDGFTAVDGKTWSMIGS